MAMINGLVSTVGFYQRRDNRASAATPRICLTCHAEARLQIMKIYLAGAMTNPDRDLVAMQAILSHIEGTGHEVPTRHIAFPDGRDRDLCLTDRGLADRDLTWLAQSEALIAEVSTPSHGVGIEVTSALHHHLPVLLLHRQGIPVSRLLSGLSGLTKQSYRSIEEACSVIDDWLGNQEKH